MIDYQQLYKQSQSQIAKQKQQIKRLEQEIRQRCQSYLIHSSRYRSKNGSQSDASSYRKQSASASKIQAQLSGPTNERQTQNKLTSNTVNVTLQNSRKQIMLPHSQSKNSNNYQQDIKISNSITLNQNNGQTNSFGRDNKKTSLDSYTGGQPIAVKLFASNQMESLSSIPSNENGSNGSAQNFLSNSTQTALPQQNAQPLVNWEQVVAGLKDRMSNIQKQKSDQAIKINELQQQIRQMKKQPRIGSTDNVSPMKKKLLTSFQYAIEDKVDSVQPGELSSLWEAVADNLNLSQVPTLDDKVKQLVSYIKQLQRQNKQYEDKLDNSKLNANQSRVQAYQIDDNYGTPYRKIKASDSKCNQRDHYEEDELEMLKRKCKQLEAQLSVSRVNKNQLVDSRTPNNAEQKTEQQQQEQIINQPAYIIEEQLEKLNDPYIKRSFVRKKVVKRNLSAMILRSPSRSKQESQASMKAQLEKLKSHLQKSKDGRNDKQIMSLSRKIDKLEHKIDANQQKIDEASDQQSSIARSSNVSHGDFTEIIQVETQGPGFKNYTAHILGLNKKDKSIHQAKKKNVPY